MNTIKTPIANFLLEIISSADLILAYEKDKKAFIMRSSLSTEDKNILIEGDHDKIKRRLYEERNLDHDMPSMYTMGTMEIAELIDKLAA